MALTNLNSLKKSKTMQIKDHRKKEIELIEILDANRKMCIEHFLQLSKEIRDLSELVSSAFGLEGWNIFAVTRKREVADARRMLAYIIRAKKGYSLEHIGEMVSIIKQDHTTVRTAILQIRKFIEKDDYFKSKWRYVSKSIEKSPFDDKSEIVCIKPPSLTAFQISGIRTR